MELEQMLSELKSAREDRENFGTIAKNIIKNATDEAMTTSEWVEADANFNEATQKIINLQEMIHAEGLRLYEETGEKNIHEKVKAKIFKTLTVADPARVLSWVKTNLADALTFDKKKVENYASKIGPVDGIETGEEVRIQIASEL